MPDAEFIEQLRAHLPRLLREHPEVRYELWGMMLEAFPSRQEFVKECRRRSKSCSEGCGRQDGTTPRIPKSQSPGARSSLAASGRVRALRLPAHPCCASSRNARAIRSSRSPHPAATPVPEPSTDPTPRSHRSPDTLAKIHMALSVCSTRRSTRSTCLVHALLALPSEVSTRISHPPAYTGEPRLEH